tara:strand:- start:65 stop:1534 length:1470 start_codon:yes stop_codon:yes gene_type:complete
MANTTETATFNVKSNIGEVGKDANSAAGEFKVMGVSLNSVKAGFASAGRTAKAMFGTIKAGIASTGIGLLLVAFASLASFFTNTKRGADQLSLAFTAMGATVDVLIDRLSSVGEALSFVFSGEFTKAGEALAGTFTGITEEINKEVTAMVNLKKRTQELRDADNDFMVQKAATRQEIERARLIAEDETKSAEERLSNLKKALELEAETTKQEIELAKERVAIQEEEMALSENSAEDEARLAQLKVALIETETASIKMRRRVVTEVNALENEIRAEQKAINDEKLAEEAVKLKAIEDEFNAKIKANDEWNKEQQKSRELNIAADKKAAADKKKIEKAKMNMQVDMANQGLSIIASAAGEGTKLAKAAAIAQATISGVQGVQNAFTSANANVGATASTFGAYPLTMAALAGTFAVMNIAKIASGGGGGGGGATPSAGGGAAAAATPAPQMMSGSFDLTGAAEAEPIKAFVVTDEMTNSQNQLANIRRRATI